MNKFLKYNLSLIIFVIIIFAFYSTPKTASAISLTPARFEVRGDPGQTLSEEMIVTNETEATETLYSSFSNFEAEGESGNPLFVAPKDDLGTWIRTDSSITVNPGQQKKVPFQISIPKNAQPGGHFAVIFWGDSPASAKNGVGATSKTGVLVLLSVNGDVKEQAGFLNFNTVDKQFFYNTLPVSFEYRFKNDGSDRVKPSGMITIRDTVFLPADHLNANPGEGNVLPSSTRKIGVDWIKYERPLDYKKPTGTFAKFWSTVDYQWKNFAVGLYSANLDVEYGTKGGYAKKSVYFFVFPWQLLMVILVIALIMYFVGKMIIRKYNKFIIEKAKSAH